jgi:DNA-directed RNA polymerase subunit RPC12/RpoP
MTTAQAELPLTDVMPTRSPCKHPNLISEGCVPCDRPHMRHINTERTRCADCGALVFVCTRTDGKDWT